MAKVNLTPEEKAGLIEAINKGVEPRPDLLPKLFPGTAEKFDVQALDRAKIPTLEYAGKRSKAAILAEAQAGIGAAPLQTVRCFGETKNGEWKNLIVQGDNLQFLKTCYRNVDPLIKNKVKGKVKLIYIDPPFATENEFTSSDGIESYSDKIESSEFIESMRERIIFMKELLADDGSIYIHLDMRMSHYVKIIMDAIFGKPCFRNSIVWHYGGRMMHKVSQFNRKHDLILFYTAKYKGYYFQLPKDDVDFDAYAKSRHEKIHVDENGKRYLLAPDANMDRTTRQYEEDIIARGRAIDDVWEIRYIRGNAKERMDYPTQKPEELLDRIIRASSKEDDLVMDIFGGSGTTAAVAEKLGRRWITCDFGKHSIYTMQRRLLRIGESKALVDEQDKSGKVIVKKGEPYKKAPKKFAVVSSGAYDFSHVMDLRKHKETYLDFVLGLFSLVRDEEKTKKYKLANIYAVKDNHPVEVYPVWDDQFLKQVKIDEVYLRGIITQSGGKLKGEYYIITPESCTNLGDTTLKNQDGKDIHFQMLTFPYKVLEDASRNFVLQEQPSSQANVNNLITSTAFYFNEDVKIAAKRTSNGLKITKFETKILDKEGKSFPGYSGLAMLLVDLDYEAGKPFDMDKTVFATDIAEDGSIILEGLTKSIGLIAVDKHGNESKPYNLE